MSLDDVKEIASLAHSVFKLGDFWYDDAPETLEQLNSIITYAERSYLATESRARRYGLTRDETLRSYLERSKKYLQSEKSRLKALNRGSGRCPLQCLAPGTKMSDQLKQSIPNLITALSGGWESETEAERAALERAKYLAEIPRFSFRRDPRYVTIRNIEGKLKDFLNHEGHRYGGAQVVLLYGSPGSGKSCMARHLALDYQEAATRDEQGAAFDMDGASICNQDGASIVEGKCFPSISAKRCRKFDRVFYLDCGPTADWRSTQVLLLNKLPDARTSETKNGRGMNLMQEDDKDASKVTDKKFKQKIDPEFNETTEELKRKNEDPAMVEDLLKRLLRDTVSLIIFDDVWDETFLNCMLGLCGKNMKVLVTAQKQSLSKSLIGVTEPVSISMDEIMPEDSFRILMEGAGFFEEDIIPEAVKKCMQLLVERVEGNPLALASIVATIDINHKEELQQWYDAIDGLDEISRQNPNRGREFRNGLKKLLDIRGC